MRSLLLVLTLLTIPSVAFAHSGTVLRTAANYFPLLFALVPIIFNPLVKLVKKFQAFFAKWNHRN
ncbi:hypothetical protein AXX12_12465 [Anaerosporomusa subterranea]|uniref:Uncharacterized protein n=1 Tax=Anaerosporomusa subterranea TaxID=1794912 RepID=A0A154BNN7_ANASB|nr:hypothetical protein [Anaerosporomusa subterranea]KYZ75521.1 hypothetical protein AXX12_12465 [Anaerosporomusa subterranea]